MRYVLIGLLLLTALLQYRFWLADGGLRDVWRLREQVRAQHREIERLRERNDVLQAELADLKGGMQSVEEIARSELGMIREGETFFRIIERSAAEAAGGNIRRESGAGP